MNILQLSALATEMNFGERAVYAGKMLVIGMGAVFGVLILLWGCLAFFRKLLSAHIDEGPAPLSAPAPAPVAAKSVPAAQANDDAIIAAITAAVAATLAEENGGVAPGFRVVSFRRVDTVSARRK